jgi:hypothetical protein
MVVPEFVISLVIAVIVTGVFLFLVRKTGRRTGLLWLFLLVFLAVWAGGVWVRPFGPTLWGIHWVSFLLIGLLVILFLVIFTPKRPPRGRHETLDMLDRIQDEKNMEELAWITLSVFFWILLFGLVIAIVLRYTLGVEL